MKGIDMNNKSKLSITSKVMFGVLAFVIITGLGAVAYAAGDTDDKSVSLSGKPIRIFDPYKLKSEPVSVIPKGTTEKENEEQDENVSGILLFNLRGNGRPPVRIPYRPALRSPYRPPLVP